MRVRALALWPRFDSNQAKRALQKHNGDVDKAVNELLGM